MTRRINFGLNVNYAYDAENRLVGVSGATTATFVYDGDGNRVKATVGGVTTLYPGKHYEYVNSTTYTKYYHAGGDLVAFTRSSGYGPVAGYGNRYVFRDHWGSTSVLVNGGGATISKELYRPYGDVRYQWRSGTPAIATQTPYRYTSQRLEVGVGALSPVGGLDRGLYFYGARWYDASLARFIQADTIVPQPGNPQALTLRQATPVATQSYAYVLNNPLPYTDPTGMFSEEEIMKHLGVMSSRN